MLPAIELKGVSSRLSYRATAGTDGNMGAVLLRGAEKEAVI